MSAFPAELTGTWDIDAAHSTVGFAVKHAVVATTRGNFGVYAGGATIDAEEVTRRILAYSVTLGSWRARVKEWRWRNGWLVRVAAEAGLALPIHNAACARLGLGG